MRIVVWHGYLLGGTGSNVYARSMARTWSRAGHDVVVVCQEPHPERYDLGGARVVRPRLDGPLPVFVLDRYADATPVLLPDLAPADRAAFVDVNAAAVREHLPADFLLANHVLLGGPVAAAVGVRSVVKIHGSELEYAIRGRADLARWARDSLATARAVVAGSEHVAGVLEEVVGPGAYSPRVRVVPPGVDVAELRPRERRAALADLVAAARKDPPNPGRADERLPDQGSAERLAAFLEDEEPTVCYVGKISEEKGVGLLLDAVRGLDARVVVVGFGPARAALEAAAGPRVLFTGPLEHRHLAPLWALSHVAVTPSVFPEAFGMVAAEAAACGCPPLVARHSGLAEIAARLEAAYPPALRRLAAFASGDAADLRRKVADLLTLPEEHRAALSAAARRVAVQQWSWERVAGRVAELAVWPVSHDGR